MCLSFFHCLSFFLGFAQVERLLQPAHPDSQEGACPEKGKQPPAEEKEGKGYGKYDKDFLIHADR